MKILLLVIASTLFTDFVIGQNKKTIFYDSVGQVTTWENHWAEVITGRYKSVYHKKENTKTLSRTTEKEFQEELQKTERKITNRNHIGTDFPDFDLVDIEGNRLNRNELKGKVLVINFWFIGCSPCEMERPSLNNLTKVYKNNDDVIFISFARNSKAELVSFLKGSSVLYKTVPTDKDYIKSTFDINAYPVNIIVDKNGKFFYNSGASGIGILEILQKYIDKALKS